MAAAVLALMAASAGGRGGLVKYYEYDEDIYLSTDGSATIYLNASIPALVNLRGLDLDTRPTANVDRAKVRRLFTTAATRVTRVSRWRRFGRQFVQVRMTVDDIRTLGSAAPFSWATYHLDRRDGLVVTARCWVGRRAGPWAMSAGRGANSWWCACTCRAASAITTPARTT